jgi:hypothetical protein
VVPKASNENMGRKRKASATTIEDQQPVNSSSPTARRRVSSLKEAQTEPSQQPKSRPGRRTEKSTPENRSKPKTKEVLRQEGVAARKLIRELRKELALANDSSHKLEQQVEDLQNAYMALRRSQSNVEMDYTEIRNGLSDIKLRCQAWAREYAIRGSFFNLSGSRLDESAVGYLIGNECRLGPMANILTLQQSQYGTYILLNMLLAEYISLEMIECPFFFLSQASGRATVGNIRQSLDELLKLIPESTLQVFYPSSETFADI